jgi:hypothetical protein
MWVSYSQAFLWLHLLAHETNYFVLVGTKWTKFVHFLIIANDYQPFQFLTKSW